MEKKKTFLLIIGVLLFGMLLVGGTYAYLVFAVNTTNDSYSTKTTCFNIYYDDVSSNATSISGTLFQSSTPQGGLSGTVDIGIDSTCNIDGIATLTLNITSLDDKFKERIDAHCEDASTLATLNSYETLSECIAVDNTKWATNGRALKYAVYNGDTPVSVGYVNRTDKIKIYDDFELVKGSVSYTVYVWLDGNLADNSYANLSFNGTITASATQV